MKSRELLLEFYTEALRSSRDYKVDMDSLEELGMTVQGLIQDQMYFADYQIAINNDYSVARRHYTIVALLECFYFEEIDGSSFVNIAPFTIALISGYNGAIDRMTGYDLPSAYFGLSAQYVRCVQAILRGRNEEAIKFKSEVERLTNDGWERDYRGLALSLGGILEGSHSQVLEGIEMLVDAIDTIEEFTPRREIVSIEALGMRCLSKLMGMDLSFQHLLVPTFDTTPLGIGESTGHGFLDDWAKSRGLL